MGDLSFWKRVLCQTRIVIDLEVRFRSIREGGNLLGFEAISRDQTERRQAELQMEKV
ncbi:MAG: hypothetical protein M2R45_00781 [Verrucomicrobia subdivision 3 bacterium]|nr:hypothetical protein [Limisphaerales bacterium]MCS1413114.1 hypothetical protein [Limisphaerales bacterium]